MSATELPCSPDCALLGAATIVGGVYKAESTADQQKEHQPDLEITRDIRRSILQDKPLSTCAHNVKVISQNGMVTPTGPVRSGEEKSAIEGKATEIAGKGRVTSQLEVKPQQ